ncbi:hypothetical protein AtubIFM55763_011211 [Aspergillus tubingensis]|nr:hypothetical protein AtubIFM54640_002648 [Aspergillus tubingensis]GLA78478.1 hypothetical protein AtubIFM55763_011211 [Aspergillus tubingensis]GLA98550.1 hypothetical protein AtubIFM57143_006842 [Aspergillus tubingensis]GLB13386.1 hypothetical protein AtubIFM61612_000795 [Aspergillus tubingensis]
MNIAQRLSSLEWHDRLNMDLSILRIYICLSAAFIVVFIFGLAFYRLYLSPLAKFPGPRLAAATGLYETYYDVVRDGQFSSHIERLHQTYGPIVRIKPWELHVKDPDNYNTLYAGVTRKRNKDSWFSFAGWPDSIFSTNGHALHRSRRSVLAQFFRRQAILDVQPLIRDNIQALCRHFRKAQAGVYAQEMEVQSMVRKAILGRGKGCSEKPKPIYPAILNNEKVPEDEKRLARLTDDAIFLVQAGTDAPGRALVLTLYYILRDPEVHKKLRSELCAAWPDATMEPGLIALEQLPYFTAVLKEGLRLSSLVSTRLPRVAPDEELHFHGYEIPRGVPVSMTTFFILRDPKIFPEPLQFIPERWLLEPEDLRKLERYLVPFSKGTLGCMGQSMAWAWLYMVLGTLLRRFEMRLYDTTERNVTPVRDKFLWQTEPGLNRVQIKVLREYS